MSQRKPASTGKRLVWRISESAPLGEFVDPDITPREARRREPTDPTASSGWVVSSFELLHGADVTEGPDTVPDDLFDELFPAPVPPSPKPTDPA